MSLTKSSISNLEARDKPYEIRDDQIKGLLLRVQPSGVKTYYVELKRGKRIKLGRPEVLSPIRAREAAKNVLLNADTHLTKSSVKLKLKDYLDQHYIPWAKNHHKNMRTTLQILTQNYSQFANRELTEITLQAIEQHTNKRLAEGVSKSTINRNYNCLKAALEKAVYWDLLEINPLRKLRNFKLDSQGVIRYLSPEEESRLREALNHPSTPEYLKAMVLLSINTGLRQGELYALKWEHISLTPPKDLVKTKWVPHLVIPGQNSKSGQTDYVPLNSEALNVFTYPSLVQTRFKGESIWGREYDNTKRSWASLLKRASITNFRWHDMRHHFASKLVMAGVPLNTVRELLRHKDIKTTLRYAHLAPSHKAEALAKIG